jgi:hypothetical protein
MDSQVACVLWSTWCSISCSVCTIAHQASVASSTSHGACISLYPLKGKGRECLPRFWGKEAKEGRSTSQLRIPRGRAAESPCVRTVPAVLTSGMLLLSLSSIYLVEIPFGLWGEVK